MKRVAASEFDLLSVIRALFHRPSGQPWGRSPGPPDGQAGLRRPNLVAGLLKERRDLAEGMGPTALGLARDTMAKGLILSLVHRGGWRTMSSLHGHKLAHGRLWQRHDPPILHLSPFAMHLCRWLTSQALRSPDCTPLEQTPATIGDEFLLYLALDLTRGARCDDALAVQRAVKGSALCWLGFADVLARHDSTPVHISPPDVSVYAFAPWLSGPGALVIEALQPDLTRRWITMERDKKRLGKNADVIAMGHVQDAVLRSFAAAIASANRRDLGSFAIAAQAALLAERPDMDSWLPVLAPGGALRVRSDARQAAVTLLRSMQTFKRWADSAALVRFFDDDYSAAQLYLRIWEQLGERRYQRVVAILRDVESIEGLIT